MIEVEANEYIASLKKEAEVLKEALRQEMTPTQQPQMGMTPMGRGNSASPSQMGDGIASYIASRKDDLQTLTDSVQPEIMDTMKMLVDFCSSRRYRQKKAGNFSRKDGDGTARFGPPAVSTVAISSGIQTSRSRSNR